MEAISVGNHQSIPSTPSVLLVDDREENLLSLEALLEPLQLEIVKATSGNDALCEAWKKDFAVILLDVQMPVMDGFETADLLRKSPRTRHIPIIFVTAAYQDHAFLKAMSPAQWIIS